MADQLPADLKCSARTVAAALKNLGVTRKKLRRVPIERNTASNILSRKLYAQSIVRKPDRNLFFLDETGWNLHNGPRYGYAFKGQTPTVQEPGNRGPNNSLLACIGLDGVRKWELKIGAYNSTALADFLDELCPELPQNAVLIMDNASFHHSEAVKSTLTRHGIVIKYLPAYSPQLNPIEEFFGMLKSRQASIRPRPKTADQLQRSIRSSFEGLDHFDMSGFYSHMRSWVEIALDQRPFL